MVALLYDRDALRLAVAIVRDIHLVIHMELVTAPGQLGIREIDPLTNHAVCICPGSGISKVDVVTSNCDSILRSKVPTFEPNDFHSYQVLSYKKFDWDWVLPYPGAPSGISSLRLAAGISWFQLRQSIPKEKSRRFASTGGYYAVKRKNIKKLFTNFRKIYK